MRSGDESQACGQPRACGQPNTQEKADPEALLAIRAYCWSNTANLVRGPERPKGNANATTQGQGQGADGGADGGAATGATGDETTLAV